MRKSLIIAASLCGLLSCNSDPYSGYTLAETPPMGWNSYDSYGIYLHHETAMQNIDAMAEKLLPYGYSYFVIDAGWYGEYKLVEGTLLPAELHASELNMNEYGLLQPSKCYFPQGLKPIIDRCHERGIKFGLHLMRGIPREAVKQNLPVKGTSFFAREIADTNSICVWNPHNYGIDMNKPGAQEFYNSLMDQMAEWGVDFIKYDDLVPYPDEVDGIVKAIEQCGRPVVLSLSPGDEVHDDALDFYKRAHMLRVTPDIWDEQKGIDQCFAAWRKWQGKEEKGFWIDMDMIPFGQLQLMHPKPDILAGNESKQEIKERQKKGELQDVVMLSGVGWNRWSEFTIDQMYTFITMRAMAASPLMVGGDLITLDDVSLKLLTNEEMIACNQNGIMGSLIFESGKIEIWKTPQRNSENCWIGIFNRSEASGTISLTPELLGTEGSYSLLNIWNNSSVNINEQYTIPANGVMFIKAII